VFLILTVIKLQKSFQLTGMLQVSTHKVLSWLVPLQ